MPRRLTQGTWWRFQAFWILYPPVALLILGYIALCGMVAGETLQRISETVVTPVVRQGEKVKVRYVFERLRTCAVKRQITIRDGSGEVHDLPLERADAVGEPGHEDVIRGYLVGEDYTPGHATLRLVLSYTCAIPVGFGLSLPNLFQMFAPEVDIYGDYPFTIAARRGR